MFWKPSQLSRTFPNVSAGHNIIDYNNEHVHQWLAMTFQPVNAVQKTILHFLKIYFNLRFFLQISSNTLFFEFNIRFFEYIL